MIAYNKLKDWNTAKETYDELIERYPVNTGGDIDDHVANAMLRYSRNLNTCERRTEALNIIEELMARFADSSRAEIQPIIAESKVFKGYILGELDRNEEAINAYKEVLRLFGKNNDQALNEQLASALNGIGFKMLCEAKQNLLNGNERAARRALLIAEREIKAGLGRNPKTPFMFGVLLGNLSYMRFLLGSKQEARVLMQRAIRLGGELIRKAELKDTTIYTLAQDKEFRALIRSVT